VSFHTTSDSSPARPIISSVIILSFKGQDGILRVSIFNSGWQSTPQTITATSLAENNTGLAMADYDLSRGPNNGSNYSVEYSVRTPDLSESDCRVQVVLYNASKL
jgi:hypothetical protein